MREGGSLGGEAPLRGPYHDWYEMWRAQQEGAARERRRHERDDRRIALMLVAYMVTGGVFGALAVALVMMN